ncbi:MAG: HlyC/CorC family transporter [Ruminococcaceae bacterium]|nr:HlyC/CorC family transporter [Oscillospiraceae bacterium]
MTVYIVLAFVCLVLSAFFSATEMAYSSSNRIRLENLADDGNRAAARAVRILDKFDDALSTLLIGNNFVNIALSSLASIIAITAFGEEYTWVATVIVTVSVIIFGETIPKIMAKKNANTLSLRTSGILRALTVLFRPLVWVSVGFINLVTAPLRGEAADDEQDAAVEELQSIIETAEDEDVLDEDRSELLQAALDFNDISAFEVMTARVDMLAIDIKDDWEDILETLKSSPYSRIPVYEGSIDNIIGVLYLNHFFKELVDRRVVDIRALLMEPSFVYKTVKLPAVLSLLKSAKRHLAIVTDEYGGVTGLITMEDVLEQLVGDIWDETDEIEPEVIEHADGVFELDGDMVMSDFFELLGREEDLFETESSTVGGWTLEIFGGFPSVGDTFRWEDYSVTVLGMDGLRVEKILIKPLAQEEK